MRRRDVAVVLAFVLVLAAILLARVVTVSAASTSKVSVYEVDYNKETMTIKLTDKDTMVYFSNSPTAKTWETVYGNVTKDVKEGVESRVITMDISWVSKTSNVTLYIKGNSLGSVPVPVTLPRQATNFKVSYNYENPSNGMTFVNLKGTKVQWRKANSIQWNTVNIGSMEDLIDEIERFEMQGITLYFRLPQIEGEKGEIDARPSKEVALKIAKRAAAPKVSIDYSKLSIAAKETMEYRALASDNNDWSDWRGVKGTYIGIDEVVSVSGNGSAEKYSIDVRTKATSSKSASIATTLEVAAQEKTDEVDISIAYTGSKQLRLTVKSNTTPNKAPSASNLYEYTIFIPSDKVKEFSYQTASWTSISSASPISISKDKAPKGSTIYVRKKATTNKLASAVGEGFGITGYPDESSLDDAKEIIKVQGVQLSGQTISIKLPESAIDAMIATGNTSFVNSIKFGSKDVKFTESPDRIKSGTAPDAFYIVTVTMTDFADVESVPGNINTVLKGEIKLNNDEVIKYDEDKDTGFTLKIIPAATANGSNLTLYKGIRPDKDYTFDILLNHDSKVVTGEYVDVSKIEIDDHPFMFEFDEFTNERDDKDPKKIKITIAGADLKEYADAVAAARQLDVTFKIKVTLDNGEEITSNIGVTTKPIARVNGTSEGFGISYKEWSDNKKAIESPIKDGAGNPIIVPPLMPNPNITIVVDGDFYAKNKDYKFDGVEWNADSILVSYTRSNGTINATISIDALMASYGKDTNPNISKAIELMFTIPSESKPVVVSTYYVITVMP